MKKRFVVGIDTITEEQEKAFLEYLKTNSLAFWHWIDNFWLIVDRSEKFTAKKLRGEIKKLIPSERLLVIEVKGRGRWSGFGPKTEKRNMFNWLHNTWSRD